MIEVEKKFVLTKPFLQTIERAGKCLGKKRFQDTYYDTNTWTLTLQDTWLRYREGRGFELKVGMRTKSARGIDRYEEISDEKLILKKLKLSPLSPLQTTLKQQRILPFCTFVTERTSYILDGFTIDIDRATSEDIAYAVAEIELLIKSECEVKSAEEKITTYLAENGIFNTPPLSTQP